jgi:hypothetical protein
MTDIELSRMLLKMDRIVQRWTKKVDKMAEDAIKKLPARKVTQPDFTCEVGQAAIKVSLALKALHLGSVKVVFRALPRVVGNLIDNEIVKVLDRGVAKFAVKKVLGVAPIVDAVASVAVGTLSEDGYMQLTEQLIHDVLGCVPNEVDETPMRFELNDIVEQMKLRVEGEPRPKKLVTTRKFN